MAIVNPAQITPYAEIPAEERELAEDLIFNRRPDALQRLIEHFAESGGRQRHDRQCHKPPCWSHARRRAPALAHPAPR